MPKNVFTMFFTCHNEFQGPLRWLCEICDCTCHLYIIDIVCRWNRHSYNPKEVPTWMEDFCSDQICEERCKNSIKVAILLLLPLCSVNISCGGIMQKPSAKPFLPSLSQTRAVATFDFKSKKHKKYKQNWTLGSRTGTTTWFRPQERSTDALFRPLLGLSADIGISTGNKEHIASHCISPGASK